jgi:hypothetical protein
VFIEEKCFMSQNMFNLNLIRSVLRGIMLVLLALAVKNAIPVGIARADTVVSGRVEGSDTSTLVDFAGYGKPNHSRVWYNSYQARWDALVPKDDGGPSGSDHYIVLDVAGSQTFTPVELEDRNSARPDSFWDDTNQQLYVLGSHAVQTKFWQVNYDAGSDSYSVNPQVNGVVVPGLTQAPGESGSNRPASLYVSPNGQVWVASMQDGALDVQHSADGGATWMAAPTRLDTMVTIGVTVWVHFEAQGVTYVGLFAGENGEDMQATFFYYWYIDQDADPAVGTNWINDSSNIPAPVGLEQADDHVSAARDGAENQYFAVKTESGAPTDPLIKLYKRTAGGAWSQYAVTTTQEAPEQSRPSLVLDEDAGVLRVYTNDTGGGNGKQKKASLTALGTLAGAPFTVLFSQQAGAFDNLITPRQAVHIATSGIVVLAHNTTEETVWFSEE